MVIFINQFSGASGYSGHGGLVGVQCSECLATVANNVDSKGAHERWHQNWVLRSEMVSVSNVKWCDIGEHAFKAGAPGSQTITGTEWDEDGNSLQVQQDVCPDHSFNQQARAARALARYESSGNAADLETAVNERVRDDNL